MRGYLAFVAKLKRLPRPARTDAVARVLAACGLEDVAHRRVGALSKGYRQRVGLAQALCGDPPILILDEPTIGLDPAQVVEIRQLVQGLRGRRTVLFSSHILSEVEAVCDRVVVIARGRIVGEGTPAELGARLGRERLEDVFLELVRPTADRGRGDVTIVAVAAKELTLYFTSLLFYALATVFLVLAGYLFYTNLDFYVRFGGMNLVLGLWQYQFHDMRQLLLVLVPLLTMRLFAEERRLGTLELLWTYPLRDIEIVAGKFLACLVVLAAILLPTLAYPLLLDRFQPVVVGPAVRGLPGTVPARRRLRRLRALPVRAHRQPARGGGVHLRRAAVLLDHHLERSGGERGRDSPCSAPSRSSTASRSSCAAASTRATSAFLVLFAAAFLAFTLLALDTRRWRGLQLTWPGRTAQGWAQLAVEAALVLAACVLLQMLAERTNRRIDLTPTRALSLSPSRRATCWRRSPSRCASPCSTGVASVKRSPASSSDSTREPARRVRPVRPRPLSRAGPRRRHHAVRPRGRSSTRAVASWRPRSPRSSFGGRHPGGGARPPASRRVHDRTRRARRPSGSPHGVGRLVAGLEDAGLHRRRREPARRRPAAGDRSGHRRRAAARPPPAGAGGARPASRSRGRHPAAARSGRLALAGRLPGAARASRSATASSSTTSVGCSAPTGWPPWSSSFDAAIRSRSRSGTRSRAAWCCRRRARWTSKARGAGRRGREHRAHGAVGVGDGRHRPRPARRGAVDGGGRRARAAVGDGAGRGCRTPTPTDGLAGCS